MHKIYSNSLIYLYNSRTGYPKKKLGLVFLHGLAMYPEYLNYMSNQLSKKNYQGYEVVVLIPKSAASMASLFFSVKKQAERVVREIKKILKQLQIDFGIPIFLIGHSQGGIRGCYIAKKYSNELNIVGIIAIASPLEGVPFLTKGPRHVVNFVMKGKKGLKKIGFSIEKTILKMVGMSFILGLISRFTPGLRDLRPKSKCLHAVKTFLHSNATIPIFLVAGEHNDFHTLYKRKKNDQDITLLSKLFEEYITDAADHDKRHDTLIPVSSQIAIHTENSLIKREVIKSALHAPNLIALVTTTCFLPAQEQQESLYEQVYSPYVMDTMHQFISSVFLTTIYKT